MYLFVLSVHIVLCLMLILVILMQPGKGADVSSAFGGGASSQLFGASGPGGQNVNKVASAVQLRFDVKNSPSFFGITPSPEDPKRVRAGTLRRRMRMTTLVLSPGPLPYSLRESHPMIWRGSGNNLSDPASPELNQ